MAEEDLQRVAQATGAAVQTTVNGLDPAVLGTCEQFQEAQVIFAFALLHCISISLSTQLPEENFLCGLQ